MKKYATDWEKILAKYITDNGMVSKIHKEILKLSNKETNNSINKQCARDLKRYLTKEDMDGK